MLTFEIATLQQLAFTFSANLEKDCPLKDKKHFDDLKGYPDQILAYVKMTDAVQHLNKYISSKKPVFVWKLFPLYKKEFCEALHNLIHIFGFIYRTCQTCGKTGNLKKGTKKTDLLKCAQCKMTFYCSKECQMKDWQSHEKICKELVQRYEKEKAENSNVMEGECSQMYFIKHTA